MLYNAWGTLTQSCSVIQAVVDLKNAELRIKDLEKDNKEWEEQVDRYCA